MSASLALAEAKHLKRKAEESRSSSWVCFNFLAHHVIYLGVFLLTCLAPHIIAMPFSKVQQFMAWPLYIASIPVCHLIVKTHLVINSAVLGKVGNLF